MATLQDSTEVLPGEQMRLQAKLEPARTAAETSRGEITHHRGNPADAELHIAVEELQQSNAELDRRVAERTAALAVANAALAAQNRALEARVQAEVAARETAQSAQFRQQKLEALGQLTGGVAHDFNNLLTVVLSGLQLLGAARTPERRNQLIARIAEAAGRGAALTHRLLAFGRRQALHPEPLDLGARLAEMGELLGHALRGDLRIETRAADGLWPIEADRGELELALLNLAVNARDAMPHGGVVILAAENRRVAAAEARRLDIGPGDYVALSVADRGVGMRPEILARLFEPFFTTKAEGQGTGLGLAQVYGFTRQSGGTTQVHSEPGNGCTVSLMLPRGRRPVPAARRADAVVPSCQPTARSAAILVVEDDFEVASLVTEMLTDFGHMPTRVASVDAALGALRNERRLDLLFSDVLLPGGSSGLDLAAEASRRRPDLPILLTTGYGGEVAGSVAGIAWPLLRKPYSPDQLRAAIDAALAGSPSA